MKTCAREYIYCTYDSGLDSDQFVKQSFSFNVAATASSEQRAFLYESYCLVALILTEANEDVWEHIYSTYVSGLDSDQSVKQSFSFNVAATAFLYESYCLVQLILTEANVDMFVAFLRLHPQEVPEQHFWAQKGECLIVDVWSQSHKKLVEKHCSVHLVPFHLLSFTSLRLTSDFLLECNTTIISSRRHTEA
jgi:hypothetical protein